MKVIIYAQPNLTSKAMEKLKEDAAKALETENVLVVSTSQVQSVEVLPDIK